ncbi:MAG: DMP19 family protein [Phycisphaerales bacterium]|nr:DUF4375 domain-containing protein [Planctomycetota bacterium]MCH8507385.1 DMP19 family protein [Phycisphaerales bacterium]
MPTDDEPPRIGPFRKIREWVIASQADWSAEDAPVPARPAGLDTRLPAVMAAELRAADPEGNAAMQILFKIGDSINEEFNAIDPDWGHPEVLPRPRRIYHAVNGLEMDVNNGGFQQYYINSWSHCAHELPGMLRDIGMPELADLVTRANAVFPTEPPANRSVRLAVIDQLGDAADEWDEMDSEFYAKNYYCQPHLVRHILAHEPDFFKV